MSLLNSLYSGISGMRNHQTMMDVVGNNIANSNTIGFKGSRVTFSDAINQMLKAGTNPDETSGGTNSMQVGLGVKTNSIDRNWSQGTFERTGITTDLALQGPGLFVLKSNGNNVYSRAGAFTFDEDGKLVNPSNGAIVQGKLANEDGIIPAGNNLEDIIIDQNQKLPASATKNINWSGNLKSNSSLTRSEEVQLSGNLTAAAAGDSFTRTSTIYNENGKEYTLESTFTCDTLDDVAGTASFTVSNQLLDSDGNVITLTPPPADVTLDFTNASGEYALTTVPAAVNLATADGAINFDFNVDDNLSLNNGSDTASISVDDGREPTIVNSSITAYDSLGNNHKINLQFTKRADNTWIWRATVPGSSTADSNDAITSGEVTFDSDGSISGITPTNPSISFTPKEGAEDVLINLDFGSGFKGITQTASSSVLSAINQDGSAAASLSNINIDEFGNIEGIFSNGKSKSLAQLLTATFSNRNGLVSVGDNMYAEYANAGEARISELGQDSATTLQSGALEQSNVDLSEEFTKMIVSQRGFQANARVITTSDGLIQEITNLVR